MLKGTPIVIEVSVERTGLFVRTTSILMCANVEDAKQAFSNQTAMAEGLFDYQDNFDHIVSLGDYALMTRKSPRGN